MIADGTFKFFEEAPGMPSDFFSNSYLREPYEYCLDPYTVVFGDHKSEDVLHGRVVVVDQFGIYLFRHKENSRHGKAFCIWNNGLKGEMEYYDGRFEQGSTQKIHCKPGEKNEPVPMHYTPGEDKSDSMDYQ
jgi:hypothetical protein